ncbi:MAG: ATP-binding protein [Solirubrobacterales bacterium]
MAYVLVLAIIALELPLALSLRERLDDEVKQQARTGANVVAVLAHSALENDNADALQDFVSVTARDTRGRTVIVDDKGEVLADSASESSVGSSLASRPEIKIALTGQTAQISRSSETLGRELLATAVPITDEGRTTGAVRVTQDVADVSSAFKRTVAGLALIGLAVLIVGLIAGAIIARQVARPLRRFEGAARAVADGDLHARAPVEGSSEQRELARTFNEMTDRLSSSLEAQSRFVADASHQLRTPLTGLRLRLEEARARSIDPLVNEQLDHGLGEADRLARTVDELLVLSQTGERDARAESLELSAVTESAGMRWRPIAESGGHELIVESDGAEYAEASRADLDRVIDALIENALAYSPEGSTVELASAGRQITVRDHGPGISDGEAVFERFYRGKAGVAQSGGTGLGLAIARELARRWGADVKLEEAEGGGTLAVIAFKGTS